MRTLEVAEVLGVTVEAVRQAAYRGRLVPSSRDGSGFVFDADEVERYQRENLRRRGPVTTRCEDCSHPAREHRGEEARCARCGDIYRPDPRWLAKAGLPEGYIERARQRPVALTSEQAVHHDEITDAS